MTDKTTRAVAYYRKSNEDDGVSVDQQREWVRRLCADEGIALPEGAEFSDQARPGHETARRQGFLGMVAYCEQQGRQGTPVDLVVCWHSNRFSRAISFETGGFLQRLMDAGVYLMRTHARAFDFRKTSDRILFNIEQDASNNLYCQNLAADAARGRARAAREGRHNGGTPPHGYRVEYREEKVKGKWRRVPLPYRVVEDQAGTVRRIWQTYADTDTTARGIADVLNREQVPGPRGLPWDGQSVGRVLRNEKYLGHMPFGKERWGKFFCVVDVETSGIEPPGRPGKVQRAGKVYVRENVHPPIITDPALAGRVRAKLEARKGTKDTRAGGRGTLLSGLLVCGACGHPMMARTVRSKAKGGGPARLTYVCSTYWRHGKDACGHNQVAEGELLPAVLRKLEQALAGADTGERVQVQIAAQERAEGPGDGRRAALARRVAELEGKVRRGAARVLEEEDESLLPAYRERLKAWQEELGAARDAVAALDQAQGPRETPEEKAARLAARVAQLREVLPLAEPALARALLHELVAKVVLFFGRREGAHAATPFAKGLIYLAEEGVESSTQGAPATGHKSNPCRPKVLIIHAADLAA